MGRQKLNPWHTISTEGRGPVQLEGLPSQSHQTTLRRECFLSTKETTVVAWVSEKIKKEELTNLIIIRACLPTHTNQR